MGRRMGSGNGTHDGIECRLSQADVIDEKRLPSLGNLKKEKKKKKKRRRGKPEPVPANNCTSPGPGPAITDKMGCGRGGAERPMGVHCEARHLDSGLPQVAVSWTAPSDAAGIVGFRVCCSGSLPRHDVIGRGSQSVPRRGARNTAWRWRGNLLRIRFEVGSWDLVVCGWLGGWGGRCFPERMGRNFSPLKSVSQLVVV